MNQLLFNPLVLLILAAISIVYLLLVTRFSNQKTIHLYLRQITISLFLFTGLNLTISPFIYLYPDALAGFDKTIASATLQLGIYAFFVIILNSWFSKFFNNTLLLFKNPFLGLLLILSALSGLWSETPEISFRAGLVAFAVSALSAHMIKDLSWSELAKLLRWVILAAALLSLLFAVIAPSIALGEKGLSGIFPYSIKLGTCMALGIGLWMSYLLEHRKGRKSVLAILVLLLALVLASNSSQAIFTTLTLVSLVGLLKILKTMKVRYAFVLIIFYAIASILLINFANVFLPIIFDSLGKDATLTGRTEFWPQLIAQLMQHRPMLGYGMNGFWQPWREAANPAISIINASSGFRPPHAHNGFLDLALSLGLVGLLLFSLSFLLTFIQAVHYFLKHQSADAILPLIILIYLIFANISETQLIGSNYIWILYVMTVVRLNMKTSQAELNHEKRMISSILAQ